MPGSRSTATFAPSFIKTHLQSSTESNTNGGLEGTDFSGKKWVWVKDEEHAFVKGFVHEEEGDNLRIICDDNTVRAHFISKNHQMMYP